MLDRRSFLAKSILSSASFPLASSLLGKTHTGSQVPKRYIFIRKSNGTIPSHLIPPTFSEKDKKADQAGEALDINLASHQLPAFMAPVEGLKAQTTIIQGLSGRMMKMDSHHPKHSCLALVDSTGEPSSFIRTSLDFELAKLLPSPFGHIGFSAAADTFGMSAGFSIKAPGLSNYVYCTPNVAYSDIFGSVSNNHTDRVKFALRDELLKFSAQSQKLKTNNPALSDKELQKIGNYAQSTENLVERSRQLRDRETLLRKHSPQLDPKLLSNTISTSDKQIGHAHIAAAALAAGVTNVVTINMDDTQTKYPELGLQNGNVHDVGHNKTLSGISATRAREIIRTQHMKTASIIIEKLKNTPEGDGNMFDNTVIYYLTDCGEAHHSEGFQWPFVIFSGKNVNTHLHGRYLRFPGYANEGHQTLGNFYTTILNSAGNPIPHYGSLDPKLEALKVPQIGPIKQLLA